jgi:hypothetical protein
MAFGNTNIWVTFGKPVRERIDTEEEFILI